MSKKEYKEIQQVVKLAMNEKMGIDLKLDSIVLLETSNNGVRYDYIMFEIRGFSQIAYQCRWSYVNGWEIEIIKYNMKNGEIDYYNSNELKI